jgi:hypothetical protein
MTYSKERLLQKLNGGEPGEPVTAEPVQQPAEPKIHNLYLKRKFNLSGCLAKAAIYLDGQLCAVLTSRGEACVPVTEGEHEAAVRIGNFVLESLKFTVKDGDLLGLLYLDQKAFTAQFVFEISYL